MKEKQVVRQEVRTEETPLASGSSNTNNLSTWEAEAKD